MREKRYCIPIDREHRRERYSNGYFDFLVKQNNSTGSKVGIWAGFIALGILFNIGFIFGIMVFIFNDEIIPAFWVCMAVGVLQLLLASLILRYGKKRRSRTSEDWIAQAVKDSHISESVLRDFDRQVKESEEIYYITLRGKKESEYQNMLTDDYLLVANTTIIPIQELLGAGFTYQDEFYTTARGRVRTMKSLAVGLITKTMRWHIFADKQLGFEFMAMLKEKNKDLILRNQEIMSFKEFDTWVKVLQGK